MCQGGPVSKEHIRSAPALPSEIRHRQFPEAHETQQGTAYLEVQPSANLVRKNFRNNTVKGRQNLHGELGLDPSFVDQIIEGVGQGQAEAGV